MTAAVYDASGRYVAPPQPPDDPRPAGPWDANRCPDCGSPVQRRVPATAVETFLTTSTTGLARRARPAVVDACTGCEWIR
jgi:hypothetical protein